MNYWTGLAKIDSIQVLVYDASARHRSKFFFSLRSGTIWATICQVLLVTIRVCVGMLRYQKVYRLKILVSNPLGVTEYSVNGQSKLTDRNQ
jgi:hypothetical protein